MAILVMRDRCKGCGLCVDACPFGAIAVEGGLASILGNCTGCGQCVEACGFDAIVRAEGTGSTDLGSYADVWVYAEQRRGVLAPVVVELLGEGRKLAGALGSRLCAALAGSSMDALAGELVAYGADLVYVADDPLLADYTTDAYAKVVCDAIAAHRPEVVLYGATHVGRDLAPRVAARVGTGLTADCTGLEIDPETRRLKQTRPAFGGNLMATIVCPDRRPQMSTVRPGVMDKAVRDGGRKGEVRRLETSLAASDIRTRVVEVVKSVKETVSLTAAEIIVSGGAGLGGPDGFELIKRFADAVGGVVGASRAAVDNGWIGHEHQVGQTGTTVKPRIYFACGISGAIQHLAGMQGSDVIVAVNKNCVAPIFDVADYGIVGDLYEVIPALIEEFGKAAS